MTRANQIIAIIKDGLANNTLSPWDNYDSLPPTDWQYAVACDDTRLGYWDWVMHNLEIDDEEPEFDGADILLPFSRGD